MQVACEVHWRRGQYRWRRIWTLRGDLAFGVLHEEVASIVVASLVAQLAGEGLWYAGSGEDGQEMYFDKRLHLLQAALVSRASCRIWAWQLSKGLEEATAIPLGTTAGRKGCKFRDPRDPSQAAFFWDWEFQCDFKRIIP